MTSEALPAPPVPDWEAAIEAAAKMIDAEVAAYDELLKTFYAGLGPNQLPETGVRLEARRSECRNIAALIRSLQPPAGGGWTDTSAILVDCREFFDSLNEWFGQRREGVPTTNSEETMFTQLDYRLTRLDGALEALGQLPPPPTESAPMTKPAPDNEAHMDCYQYGNVPAKPAPAPSKEEVATRIMADLAAWLTQYTGPTEPLKLLHAEITSVLASAAQQRQNEIVAWLRKEAKQSNRPTLFDLADAIERGEARPAGTGG